MPTDLILLFGGTSNERRVSVASAQHIQEFLPDAEPWFWAPDDTVHRVQPDTLRNFSRPFERDFDPGNSADFASLEDAVEAGRHGTFFLALHGGAGEDGRLQHEFEVRGIPFTGSGSRASRTAFDKLASREIARRRGIRIASATVLPDELGRSFRQKLELMVVTHGRVVVKPVASGSSVGVHHLKAVKDIPALIEKLHAEGPCARFVEAFEKGREVTVGVVDGLGGPKALAVSEVIAFDGGDFDFDAKYLGHGVREITPAALAPNIAWAVQKAAITMHTALGCEGCSRTDLIVTGRGVTFLETNTLPGLTKASFIPQQLAASNIPFKEFLKLEVLRARSRAAARRQLAAG